MTSTKTSATPSRLGARQDANLLSTGALRALRPWAEIFADMPAAHLRVLGHLLETIGPLVETADQSVRDGRAELDSFDDLATVGPLDRLITSELLWLKLEPNEFVRRIAEREALRRRPEYRDRAEQRAVVVVVDAGVEMLGRLRLVALAGLLSIGAASHRRGARFIWTSTGLTGEPAWIDGLSRRGLSRFVRQTGLEGLEGSAVARLMAVAPDDVSGSLVWSIGRKDATIVDIEPEFRLELSEQPPAEDLFAPTDCGTDDSTKQPSRQVEASVVASTGARRTATLLFPDEKTAADLLRAPFRANSSPRPSTEIQDWSATWLAIETDETALYLRHGQDVALVQHGAPALTARLPPDSQLLGARLRLFGPSTLVWRRDDEIFVARFLTNGEVFSRGAAQVSADHPLILAQEREGALPTLIRHSRRVGAIFAGPDGRMYSMKSLTASDRAFGVERVEHHQHLRVLSRSKGWLLAVSEKSSGDALVLSHLRKGVQRVLHAAEPPISVRDCALVGDAGGALLATPKGWRWAPPHGLPAGDDQHPPVSKNAILLQVNAPYHATRRQTTGSGQKSPTELGWDAWFWSREDGLRRYAYNGTAWSDYPGRSPELEGNVLAMKRVGRQVYALMDDDGSKSLFEFQFNSLAPARRKEVSAAEGRREGRCIAL